MLQRLHLASTFILLIGAALLGARAPSTEASYKEQLAELGEAVKVLQEQRLLIEDAEPGSAGETEWSRSQEVYAELQATVSSLAPEPVRTNFDHLAVGDVIVLTDYGGGGSVSGEHTVADDGMIAVRNLGWVDAAGKTTRELGGELSESLAGYVVAPPRVVAKVIKPAAVRIEPRRDRHTAPGDVLRVLDEAHPRDVNFGAGISADGTVLLDQIGRIQVTGLTRADLEKVLTERYEAFYTTAPSIRVTVTPGDRISTVR